MNKFSVRDLVNAGVFSLLVLVASWCGGMIGFIPQTMPFVPFACGILGGIVFMLYSTKIDKFGMILIMGILFGIAFSLSGHGAIVFPGIVIISLLAEWILKKGNYKSIKYARLSFATFMLFGGVNILPMYYARQSYIEKLISQGYGEEYVKTLFAVMPNWSFIPVTLLGIVGGFIGCTIGIKLLNKHFKKAGMA
ncbi:MptD family putative ECF transporter S component [Anaerococcus sp. AGMB00486]|uniref:MptD family putative ECF transporter S component n=2 Tax=Anaerococcus TaxID=165779 RepID=A0ABX2NA43_9FIRM|nr:MULTISPECIES: MptD family putative ECF transporter S component [Anaerococcus]MDY3006719.1 MptD family putative ECF transporter S component [Anaerococcus porci]MSS77714.1 MptD family putative ECF transporter S component [Anaerococcus porci]NVF11570.1 MptD family putative ECF transporter S component [Anaerococcus faecalis]